MFKEKYLLKSSGFLLFGFDYNLICILEYVKDVHHLEFESIQWRCNVHNWDRWPYFGESTLPMSRYSPCPDHSRSPTFVKFLKLKTHSKKMSKELLEKYAGLNCSVCVMPCEKGTKKCSGQ